MKDNTDTIFNSPDRPFKTLIIQGEQYETLYTAKFENRKKWIKPDVKKISSFLPGTILEINASDGDKVTKDDVMLVLEAMKMQNTYYFPFTGTIKKVYIKQGDTVPKGCLLLEYE